jgi:electron transfer flavoprotein beta subunit
MEGLVGPLLGEALGWPWLSSVVALNPLPQKKGFQVEREIEGGLREAYQISLPALLTIQSSLNTPRYPTLSNLLKARKQPLEVQSTGSLEPQSPRQKTLRFHTPEKMRAGVVLEGTSSQKADQLVRLLKEKAILT